MNARGERILIFGDSLTRHTSGEVWNVNAGSMRSSSAPGDLLASLLAEQGAAAVRTNARVSRSAWNFWGREAAGDLIAADLAWKPTKVIVMLGTNDVGIDPRKVRDAFTAIRDAYRGAGAEVWAIGPFISNKPPAGVQIVVKTMASVFGMRFIDGRPLSELAQRAGDGLHYTAAGARTLSLILADTLVRKVSPTTVMRGLGWGLLGIGVALVAGYTMHRKGLYTLNGDGAEAVGVDGDDVIDAEFTELGDVRGLLAAGPGELEGFLRAPSMKPELEGAADDDDDDENFGKDDWFERIAAKSAARKAGMREALAKHDAVFITHGTRKILLVKTPEMSNPEEGSIRVMSFDADGPIGHTTRKTLNKIADELTDDWHPDVIEPATMAEVDAFTGTEQFAKGSEAVIAVQKANAGLKGTPETLTVKRAKDFRDSHNYEVRDEAGALVALLFRDPESREWYEDQMPGQPQTHYTERWRGSTQAEAAAAIARRRRERAGLKGGEKTKVRLVGPRNEDLQLTAEVDVVTPTVGIRTDDGRTFLYDKLVSDPDGVPTYREFVELNGTKAGAGVLRWKKISPGVYHATSPAGLYIIDGNNAGRNRWTVTYPGGDYGMVDALTEAKAWANQDAEGRAQSSTPGSIA